MKLRSILEDKRGRVSVGPNAIVSLIMVLIFATILLSVGRTTIPTAATAYHNLSDSLASETDVLGTDAAAFAGDTDGYVGWFWALGPFVLVIGIVMAVFMKKRR